jgi:hypothetical protein
MSVIDITPTSRRDVDVIERPLVYIAAAVSPFRRPGAPEARRLEAIASEFGHRTYIASGATGLTGPLSPDDQAALDQADLVVCEIPSAEWGLPVELALASVRRIPTIALLPADEVLSAASADVLEHATRLRYARGHAASALHAHLATGMVPMAA